MDHRTDLVGCFALALLWIKARTWLHGTQLQVLGGGGRSRLPVSWGTYDVVLIARFTGVIAAIVWLIGAPLVSLAGVPFPSDAQYLVVGTVAALLGLALAPVTLAIGAPIPSRTKTFVQFSGLAVCIALIASGGALILAVQGRLGQKAPRLIPDTTLIVLVALFVWISVASFTVRGPSRIERSIFWLGLLAGASLVVPALASILLFYFAQGFVFTNMSVLPFLLIGILLWISLPAWLTAVVVGLSPKVAT